MGDGGKVVLALLSNHDLDLHMFFFKIIIFHNFNAILHEDKKQNQITGIWHKKFASTIFNYKLLKYIK